MSWSRWIAAFVLLVLAALPVGRTICAIDCHGAPPAVATSTDSHRACAQTAASSGPQLESRTSDACGAPDAELAPVVTTRTERADLGARSSIVAVGAIVAGLAAPSTGQSLFEYTLPPGVAPPTARPIVLRV